MAPLRGYEAMDDRRKPLQVQLERIVAASGRTLDGCANPLTTEHTSHRIAPHQAES
jgi:hypothetical protein